MASYFPMVKNLAQRIVFPLLDADGDPVTGAAADSPDSEYSLDGGAFADIADEIHEIATASGIYYLDLTAGETNGDVVCIQIKTATAGTKTTVLVFYTSAQSLDTVDTNVDAILVDTGTTLDGKIATVDTVVDAIKAVTDLLPNAGALSDLATILADTNELQADWANGGRLDLLIDAIITYVDLIDDATDGLAAIKAEVEGLAGAAMRGTDNALLAAGYTAPDNAGIAILLTRITATVALASSLVTHDTEIKALLATVQADLDNPDQYKANVAALALEATLTAIKGAGWTNETLKLIKELVDELESGEKPKPKAHFRI